MIYGSATHIGCGISAYTEYAFYDNNAALNYNVCIYTTIQFIRIIASARGYVLAIRVSPGIAFKLVQSDVIA